MYWFKDGEDIPTPDLAYRQRMIEDFDIKVVKNAMKEYEKYKCPLPFEASEDEVYIYIYI